MARGAARSCRPRTRIDVAGRAAELEIEGDLIAFRLHRAGQAQRREPGRRALVRDRCDRDRIRLAGSSPRADSAPRRQCPTGAAGARARARRHRSGPRGRYAGPARRRPARRPARRPPRSGEAASAGRRGHLECWQAGAHVLLPLHSTVCQLGAEQRIRGRRHAHLQPVDPDIVAPAQLWELQRGRSARADAEAAIGRRTPRSACAVAPSSPVRATARRRPRARARASRPRPRARLCPALDRAALEPHAGDAQVAYVDLAVAHDQLAHPPVRVQGGGRAERRLQLWPCGRERDPAAALQRKPSSPGSPRRWPAARVRSATARAAAGRRWPIPGRARPVARVSDSAPSSLPCRQENASAPRRRCRARPGHGQGLGAQLRPTGRGDRIGQRAHIERHRALDVQIGPQPSGRRGQLGVLRVEHECGAIHLRAELRLDRDRDHAGRGGQLEPEVADRDPLRQGQRR